MLPPFCSLTVPSLLSVFSACVLFVCQLLPVAYGIMKLRIICIIEDDKIALDDLTEAIEEFEEVQSVDIDAFNKI